MSDKVEEAAKRDVAALAAELAGQIASLSAFAGSGLASQGFTAAPRGTTSSANSTGSNAGHPSYAGPRTMLENAGRFASPVLPAGAALRPVKAALLRVLRIVTRDQTTFNSALLEALRGALVETEATLDALASASREAGEAVRRAEAALERAVVGLPALSARVGREAAARESAGRELAASQHRLDALEKDRDARFEALARAREKEAEERKSIEEELLGAHEAIRGLRIEWSTLRSNLQAIAADRESVERPAAASMSLPVRADDPLRAGLYVDFEEHFR
ncbi:MAG: hypothetical protein ACXWFS_07380, partial [Thermoanaerobaculia bacterium]